MNHEKHERVLYADEVYAIEGALFEVSRHMGTGFLESVYQECLTREFQLRSIPFNASPRLGLSYKGESLRQTTSTRLHLL